MYAGKENMFNIFEFYLPSDIVGNTLTTIPTPVNWLIHDKVHKINHKNTAPICRIFQVGVNDRNKQSSKTAYTLGI